MRQLLLTRPSLALKDQALDYKREHFRQGETQIHGSSLLDTMDYEPWLEQTLANADGRTALANWVPSDTFFALDQAGRIVGIVDIRRRLNEFLANYGGHIGYSVRPSLRRQGYGTAILSLALDHARGLGLDRVMLACNAGNAASRGLILKFGGVLEREFVHTDGQRVQVFWITL